MPRSSVREDDDMDLVEFLRARLDEDEEAAKRVHQPYRLYACDDGHVEEPMLVDDPYGERNGEYQQWEPGEDRLPNHHNSWALIYDPARVLAEVDAKRRIVAMHTPVTLQRMVDGQMQDVAACDYDTDPDGAGWTDYPCETLRILAATYKDHPDYRDEWRP